MPQHKADYQMGYSSVHYASCKLGQQFSSKTKKKKHVLYPQLKPVESYDNNCIIQNVVEWI